MSTVASSLDDRTEPAAVEAAVDDEEDAAGVDVSLPMPMRGSPVVVVVVDVLMNMIVPGVGDETRVAVRVATLGEGDGVNSPGPILVGAIAV